MQVEKLPTGPDSAASILKLKLAARGLTEGDSPRLADAFFAGIRKKDA